MRMLLWARLFRSIRVVLDDRQTSNGQALSFSNGGLVCRAISRRDAQGQFKKEVDVRKSFATDRRQHAKTKVKKGEGGRGDE